MESTYRIQLTSANSLIDVAEALPYFRDLGITQLYLSPILRARSSSSHGYDCVDPREISPQLGGSNAFDQLLGELKHHPNMGLLLDIVPNHMAISSENPWWQDVLEQGPSSQWSSVFAFSWFREETGAFYPVVLPFLGEAFHKLVQKNELKLGVRKGRLNFTYYEQEFPLEPRSYLFVFKYLEKNLSDLKAWETIAPIVEELRPQLNEIPRFSRASGEDLKTRRRLISTFHEKWFSLLHQNSDFNQALEQLLFQLSEGSHQSFFESLLQKQVYRLEFWKTGSRNINYRRFFDINELVAVRIEDKKVFDKTHSYIFELTKNPEIKGLRVDHVDGLSKPAQYVERLSRTVEQVRSNNPPDIYVEKILETHERLRSQWPVAGTTGYEFMNRVNALFVDPTGFALIEKDYKERTGQMEEATILQLRAKQYVLKKLFRPDFERLNPKLRSLCEWLPCSKRISTEELFRGFEALSLSLPVYRVYIEDLPASDEDLKVISQAFSHMNALFPQIKPAVTQWWKDFFFKHMAHSNYSDKQKHELLDFVIAWQQVTSPLMAKGHEDTYLYRYYPLSSLNEVGGEPTLPENPDELFHHLCQFQAQQHPKNINASSTHDSKRGEDVRARINVLSEMPEEWVQGLSRWMQMNRSHKKKYKGELHPVANTEILIYQTLIGTWPLDDDPNQEYITRIQSYLLKALREKKRHTSWREPEGHIEKAVHQFIQEILTPEKSAAFLEDFRQLQDKTQRYGLANSLNQLVLKMMAPGLPDFYFGSELWNLRLVDPDNREPVNFSKMKHLLDKTPLEANPETLKELLSHWHDGQIKLHLTRVGLQLRQKYPDLFGKGSYQPVLFSGPLKSHFVGFLRQYQDVSLMVICKRYLARWDETSQSERDQTQIVIDEQPSQIWKNILTGETLDPASDASALNPAALTEILPCSILLS